VVKDVNELFKEIIEKVIKIVGMIFIRKTYVALVESVLNYEIYL